MQFLSVRFPSLTPRPPSILSSRSISEGGQNPQLNTRRTTAKIVVGLTVVFMISYVPYHVIWTYVNYTKNQKVYFSVSNDLFFEIWTTTHLFSTCLLLINSCLNPVALFCTSSPFRQHLKRYLTCCCKTNSPPADLELTRSNWVGSQFLYFLQLHICYIFHTDFHLANYSNDNENCEAVRNADCVQKLNICTVIFRYIRRKININWCNKVLKYSH